MTPSRKLLTIAGKLIMVDATLHRELCYLAVEVAVQEAELITLREWADETVGNACEDAQTLEQQSRAIADVIRPIVSGAR